MDLRRYLTRYRITIKRCSEEVGISQSAIWHYMSGRRRPCQRNAEALENWSDGLVTVLQSRGKDDRIKSKGTFDNRTGGSLCALAPSHHLRSCAEGEDQSASRYKVVGEP